MSEPAIRLVIKAYLDLEEGPVPEGCPEIAERDVTWRTVPRIGEELSFTTPSRSAVDSAELVIVSAVWHAIDDGEIEVHVRVPPCTMANLVETHGFRPCSS